MKTKFIRNCTIAGAIGLFAACTDSPSSAPTPRIGPTDVPAYDASTPFNNAGQCMADDAVRAPTGTISGVKFGDDPLTATNCTSQDVKIATAQVINYLVADSLGNFSGTPIPFDSTTNVTCNEGRRIQLTMSAKLNETASSARSDIGIWLATDGGKGITGACNHYNLPTNPLEPGTGVSNSDNDSCGDLNSGAVVPSFELGTFVAVCETAAGSTSQQLHIGSCLGWKEPGGDKVCPLPDAKPTVAPNWVTDSPDGFRFGTLYANKSKCNCDGFDVPITVVRPPNLTISKTADSASVSAGSQIGFVVTLSNTGVGPAQNVAVNDPLPSGTGVSWSIATPVTGWSITGSAPNQTLVFSAVSFANGATSSVHVVSSTTSASCKQYSNTATASLTNGTAPQPVTATTTVGCPTIGITKTPASQTKNAGESFSWTVTLTNNGPGTASGANISDPLPPLTGVSYSLGSGSDATCAITSGTLTCGPKTLAANGTITAIINATTTAGTSCSASGITNTATGKATGVSDVQASATTVINCPSLSISKLPASQTKNAGESFSWTVTLSNGGSGTAVGASINDPLPALTGVSYALGSGSDASCAITSGTLTCGPKDLAASGTIVAIINATTTAGTSCSESGIVNTATGKTTGVSDVQASATTVLNCPSIGITKTPASQTKNAGESFSWTVVLTNTGNGTAVGANINDPLPTLTGVSYSLGSGSDASCTITSGTLTCGPKDLAKNGTITAIINATTTAGTSCSASGITNTATGKATGVSDVQATATTVLNCPNIGITKLPASQTISAGGSFSWTVTLTNSGAGTAVNAAINDPLPVVSGVSYSLGSGSDATCAITNGTLTCGPKNLAQNGTIVAIISATTTASAVCSSSGFTNTATGSASGVSNVQASATTIIACPNLSITKTPKDSTNTGYFVTPPDTADFVITVRNSSAAGTGTANNVFLTDTLPAGLTWSANNNACTIPVQLITGTDGKSHQLLSCDIGSLAAGASFTVTVSASVPGSFVQQPPSPAGTPIEVDGDLTDGGAAGKDWGSLGSSLLNCLSNPRIGCDIDLPTGTADNSFGQGTKEDTPVPTVVTGSIPNNKSDLLRFYVSTERFVSNNFLYLAWERVQAPNGTTNMDFELNQSTLTTANGYTPVRTSGDILVLYDLSKGGSVPTLAFSRWVTTGNAATLCEASNTVPCWGKRTAILTGASAAVNLGTVTDPILAPGQASARTLDALTFGEASIDLQTTGIFQSGSCVSFGRAYLKSRSSDAFTSEIKDFIAPIPISVTNCAPVKIPNTAWVTASNVSAKSDSGEIKVNSP